jgi:hypothetical protein
MFNRFLTVKRRCRNNWPLQPRDTRGWWLSYDGTSPQVDAAARKALQQQRHARVQASLGDLKEGIIANVIMLLVTSPPPLQRALAAWDAPPEAGYI